MTTVALTAARLRIQCVSDLRIAGFGCQLAVSVCHRLLIEVVRFVMRCRE